MDITGESWSEEAKAKDPLSKNFKCWKVELANPEVLAEPKYQLPPEPEFMKESIEVEIPAYEDQGQTRGRKPKREPKNSQSKKRVAKGKKAKVDQSKNAVKVKKGKKALKRGKLNKGRKAKMARVRRAASGASLSDLPPALSAGSRAKNPRKTKASCDVPGGDQAAKVPKQETQQFDIPDDAIPAPSHCKQNSVYSVAYRRAQAGDATTEECKVKGRHASWLLRVHNMISPGLSGQPKGPRGKNNKEI